MLEEQMEQLIREAIAQGFRVRTLEGGARVFDMGVVQVVIRAAPATRDEWRTLLICLTAAGLLWPPRTRPRR